MKGNPWLTDPVHIRNIEPDDASILQLLHHVCPVDEVQSAKKYKLADRRDPVMQLNEHNDHI